MSWPGDGEMTSLSVTCRSAADTDGHTAETFNLRHVKVFFCSPAVWIQWRSFWSPPPSFPSAAATAPTSHCTPLSAANHRSASCSVADWTEGDTPPPPSGQRGKYSSCRWRQQTWLQSTWTCVTSVYCSNQTLWWRTWTLKRISKEEHLIWAQWSVDCCCCSVSLNLFGEKQLRVQ